MLLLYMPHILYFTTFCSNSDPKEKTIQMSLKNKKDGTHFEDTYVKYESHSSKLSIIHYFAYISWDRWDNICGSTVRDVVTHQNLDALTPVKQVLSFLTNYS